MTEDRMWHISKLVENWPKAFGPARLKFVASEIADFPAEDVAKGIQHVLRTCEYPPTVSHVYNACSNARKRRITSEERKERAAMPGDTVHGQRTMGYEECCAEYLRMKKEHPDAFTPGLVPVRGLDRLQSMENIIHRIYVKSLKTAILRCGKPLPEEQIDLFGEPRG